MNKLRNLCVTFMLLLALCASTFADDGIMGTGGPSRTGGQTSAPGQIDTPPGQMDTGSNVSATTYALLNAGLSVIGDIIVRL